MRKKLLEKYFLDMKVRVKSGRMEYEGILKGYSRSKHGGIGNLLLEKDGVNYVIRKWSVIILDG